MELLPTTAAADLLGVTDRQVRHLVVRGELVSPRRGWIESGSVDAYAARRGPLRHRVWSPRTSWAALELLSGGAAGWQGRSQRSRLRAELRASTPEQLVSRLRNRSDIRTFASADDFSGLIRSSLVAVRDSGRALDGYVDRQTLGHLVTEASLVPASGCGVVLRVVPDDVGVDFVEVVDRESDVLAGVDLASSDDSELRAAGLRVVAEALDDLRG